MDKCNEASLDVATELLASNEQSTHRQLEFLQQLRVIESELTSRIANSVRSSEFLDELVKSVRHLFTDSVVPCLLWCDKDMSRWSVINYAMWQSDLVSPIGQLSSVPQSIVTFVASPSRQFGREERLLSRPDWALWQPVLSRQNLSDCILVSCLDEHNNWLTLCLFYDKASIEFDFMNWAINQFIITVPKWLDTLVKRRHADKCLQNHIDESTGLLQRHSFDQALDRMLRDARRYFFRLAFLTVFVREVPEKDEMKLLSDTLKETLRDNDLLACSAEHEFVMAMRIGQLDDAEVVAKKIVSALSKIDPNEVSILAEGIALGLVFYPEHPDQESLYFASKAAAQAVTEKLGYRLEYYGKFVHNLDEAYQE